MAKKAVSDEFSKSESAERFKAALLGSRIAGPMPMKPKKKPRAKKVSKKKQATK